MKMQGKENAGKKMQGKKMQRNENAGKGKCMD